VPDDLNQNEIEEELLGLEKAYDRIQMKGKLDPVSARQLNDISQRMVELRNELQALQPETSRPALRAV
jgi:hypothetical protein